MRHLPLLSLLLSVSLSHAQPLDTLFQQAKRLDTLRYDHIFSDQMDSIFGLFDSTMFQLLTHPDFCESQTNGLFGGFEEPVDSLQGADLAYGFMNNLICAESGDERIRLFSWDDLEGGSGHAYTNFLQIKSEDGSCSVLPFDTLQGNVEVGYYQIEVFEINQRTIYVLLGYGSYGGGMQHRRLRFFEFQNDLFKECFEFYTDGNQFVIECNRSQNPEITLNPLNGTIAYSYFHLNENTGFYEDEFVRTSFPLGKISK